MMWIFEVVIIGFFVANFVRRERPNVLFFFLGFLFSVIAFVLKMPITLIMNSISLENTFSSIILSGTIIAIAIAVINEITRYLSLKRFLSTRSYKNGILFGFGWATFSVLIFFQNIVIAYFLSILPYFETFEIPQLTLGFLEFTLLLTTILAQTIFIVFAVLKNKKRYVIYSILYSILIYMLTELSSEVIVYPEYLPAKAIAIIINLIVFFQYKIFR